MGSTKLIFLSLVLVYNILIAFDIGYASTGRTLCDKEEDIYTILLRENADLIERVKQNILSGKTDCKCDCELKPMDCAEVLRSGHTKSGVYTIWPKNKIIIGNVEVYCDMDTDGGGWTVIQRRGDYGQPDDYFFKGWESYKKGFGDLKQDFWLGNDLIYAIANQTRYSIRFDLGDFGGNTRYALYENFWIEDESAQYRLHISNYSGNAGDSISYQDNMNFSTKDRDNDPYSEHCAERYKGAWWYKDCHYSNLNGLYLKGSHQNQQTWVIWRTWKGHYESLKTTEMKIRPK